MKGHEMKSAFGTVSGLAVILVFLAGCKSKPDQPPPAPAPDAGPVVAAPVAPDKLAVQPAPAPETDPAELRIEHRDGGVFIVNKAGKGQIIQTDGGVLLTLQQEPGEEPPVTPPVAQAAPGKTPPPSGTDDIRGQVQAYLFKMDTLQAGPAGVKPQQFANSIVGNVSKGKLGDFDKLIDDLESVEDKMAAIDPPAPCLEFHKASSAMLDESQEILGEMRDMLKSKQLEKLETLVSRANKLQKQAQKLEKMRAGLQQSYGLN
jgi:hypothetical protein